MPPEVLLGHDSQVIDVWSLGIILVELLNGIPIWYLKSNVGCATNAG
jgi:serine/threonine protein kinase